MKYRAEQLAAAVLLSIAGLGVAAYRLLRGCHCDGCNP